MFKNLIPWKRKKDDKNLQIHSEWDHPFMELHKSMNDLFDNFFGDVDHAFKTPFSLSKQDKWMKTPQVDVVEKDKAFIVKADLPGIDEKDIQVHLDGDMLTIKGETSEEKENKKGTYYLSERRYGSFSRTIPLQQDVIDKDKIKATFKRGVLKLELPKIKGKESDSTKQIDIKVDE